ncbi:HAD family hydrolase [Brachybacterium sp. DNPG3]
MEPGEDETVRGPRRPAAETPRAASRAAPRAASLAVFRELVRDRATHVVVSDLDGVLRRFDPALFPGLDARLDRPRGTSYRAILRSPLLREVVRGRATHAQWRERIAADLQADGIAADEARAVVGAWLASTPVPDPDVRAVLDEARRSGREVFVFTNGTDRVREELRDLGVDDLLGPAGERLLNSAELGAAKPDREAFDAAHARIEQVLGRSVPRDAVAFLDDSAGHVAGAVASGWRAQLLER